MNGSSRFRLIAGLALALTLGLVQPASTVYLPYVGSLGSPSTSSDISRPPSSETQLASDSPAMEGLPTLGNPLSALGADSAGLDGGYAGGSAGSLIASIGPELQSGEPASSPGYAPQSGGLLGSWGGGGVPGGGSAVPSGSARNSGFAGPTGPGPTGGSGPAPGSSPQGGPSTHAKGGGPGGSGPGGSGPASTPTGASQAPGGGPDEIGGSIDPIDGGSGNNPIGSLIPSGTADGPSLPGAWETLPVAGPLQIGASSGLTLPDEPVDRRQEVPAPAAVLLFGIGLLALGIAGTWRSRA